MNINADAGCIAEGRAVLGIEFGSTRIKAVLINEKNEPIAAGGHNWENHFENGVWTYPLEEVWAGLADAYADLKKNVADKYGITIKKLAAIGISAMMHGYIVLDSDEKLLVPFRTWRNTITGPASEELTKLFGFHIPQRWSVAHLYQAVLNGEEHVNSINVLTTLAGYVHRSLTGVHAVGVGEASGMFPIDSNIIDYDQTMADKFDALLASKNVKLKVRDILPKVLNAGTPAGNLTAEGALLLDPTGALEAGAPMCPPEGDAGTGMAATNAVRIGTGNVSAGTSIFGMVVMDKPLSHPYDAIDVVTTPDGAPVAMVHCNNCSSDINAWVGLFAQVLKTFGAEPDMGNLYTTLFNEAMKGEKDGGGILSYNYVSGEHITGVNAGRPMVVRTEDTRFNLANFMRVQIMTSMGALKKGFNILIKDEHVKVSSVTGHGGLFKTEGVAQSILAGAIDAPVSVMETAGEGGAWGMALLAGYMLKGGVSLPDYLDRYVFADVKKQTLAPDPADEAGFDKFFKLYEAGIEIEKIAGNVM